MVALVSFENLMVNLATIICAPATPQILQEFHSKNALDGPIIVSIWELGEILGPLMMGPLSELYGRFYIYNIANVFFTLFSIASALSTSIKMLIGFRFLSGIAVASTTLNAGTVVDMFPQFQRGTAMSIMGFSRLVGVVCGPILGGYVSANLSWRWAFWLVAIVAGSLEVGFLLFFRETYSFTILERKAKRLRRETGNANLRSKYDQGKSAKDLFKRAIVRPAKMLIFSHTVMMLSLYNSLVYGYLYLVITILPSVFQDVYHFKQGPVGLTYLGIGIGMTLAVVLCRLTFDRLIRRQTAKAARNHDTNHHESDQALLIDPEYRLPPYY
ncbi:hypothetical protein EAE96_009500 [Botrytis aclada]|nr:hypothetical protein EAE96_009500 [Botrytis aclada]